MRAPLDATADPVVLHDGRHLQVVRHPALDQAHADVELLAADGALVGQAMLEYEPAGSAEVGLIVRHGEGEGEAGAILLCEAAELAASHGVTALHALHAPGDAQAREILDGVGLAYEETDSGGETVATIDLAPLTEWSVLPRAAP